jgi:tRNA pseudouridine55 synthase
MRLETQPSDFYGFLLVNKPAGIPSFRVVKKVRYITGCKKVGYAGTLDPFATGLLIVALGKAYTKQLDSFLNLSKTYAVKFVLGLSTDTLDTYGKVDICHKVAPKVSQNLDSIVKKFIGKQGQSAPMFSARKVDGTRLYKLARQGISVDIEKKEIEIYDIKVALNLAYSYPMIGMTMVSSKGTYVRSFVRDFAEELNTVAYAKDLERTQIGSYHVKDAVHFDEITKESVLDKLFLESC